jgi:hypothetical protein
MGQERIIRNLDSGCAVAVIALDGGSVPARGSRTGGCRHRRGHEQAVAAGLAEWFGRRWGR